MGFPPTRAPNSTRVAATGLEKSENRGVQAARNAPSEDRKCWQRVELGIHGPRSWGRNWSRKVRETQSSGGRQGREASRPQRSLPPDIPELSSRHPRGSRRSANQVLPAAGLVEDAYFAVIRRRSLMAAQGIETVFDQNRTIPRGSFASQTVDSSDVPFSLST